MNAPNTLTIIRILLAPIYIVIFIQQTFWAYAVCMGLFLLSELTDYLDGKIARRYNQISVFGKIMDPFADSISRFSIFISFLSIGLAPVWLIVVFFYRDVLVAIVRVFAMREGVVVSARTSGKHKAWVQAVCIFAVLAILILQKKSVLPPAILLPFHIDLITAILGLAAIVTVWSGVDYWLGNYRIVVRSLDEG